jgi:hypothetical protein
MSCGNDDTFIDDVGVVRYRHSGRRVDEMSGSSALWETTPEMKEAMKSPDKKRIDKLTMAINDAIAMYKSGYEEVTAPQMFEILQKALEDV